MKQEVADATGQLFHWDGGDFSNSISPQGQYFNFTSLAGAGDNALFVSAQLNDGGYGVLHHRR